ncbi:MurR/RpiR family transcriptional regulator [Piscinibacter sp.]|jgi:DNA-binding MurR/RpiR family transcriptional regulator|uniref:MurR/RpiR family transcriptional regulator n=1 Tax=Piscinibacter sp. TaxID=1903157 RepID=UPI001B73BCF6|nr:MurR/RpiR family transcriptional regulator [Piscinibacter sp.]MBK7533665.1 MurR/RpiR family transcriptional regulator [Piscinibacter sp.]MBL0092660.1 MurR/RpiR family transcriptional regulator [Piscinibacter sp.]MBP6541080.1 MurR/RpiR family transcriptional regulator [Piscinibacter sp.]HOY35046.1 MurR/RpiR family transcriptional regulator [Piscinibacter sp.]HPG77021.1 MurR/RpiR family transcriptional regulator [Piscinibacter sp.]
MDKPATLDQLRDAIGQASESLTPRARAAAQYALEHPNDIALQPVAAVAQASGIAASAFIRMAQSLGFSGYGELQRLFLAPLQRAAAPSFRERIRHFGGELAIEDPSDPTEVLRAFSQANMVSLEHLRDDAASLDLDRAIRLIRQARLVHVLGLRRSYAVAAYLAYALNRVGRPSVQITGLGGAIAEQAGAVGPRDLLIAISFPPYAADTLQVCEQVQRAGAKRLAITDGVLSPVARGAELVLAVNDAGLLGFRSLTSAMCLAQTLAMGLAFRDRRGGQTGALDDIDC